MPPEEPADDAIANEIGKGTVILWEDFEFFETGEKKASRFLILSNYDSEYRCFLAVRATTKTEYYEKPTSTVTREFIIIPSGREKPLPAKSAIDFAKIRTLSLTAMKASWGKEVKRIGAVSDELVVQIDKLVNNSRIIRKDWIKWILNSPKKS